MGCSGVCIEERWPWGVRRLRRQPRGLNSSSLPAGMSRITANNRAIANGSGCTGNCLGCTQFPLKVLKVTAHTVKATRCCSADVWSCREVRDVRLEL